MFEGTGSDYYLRRIRRHAVMSIEHGGVRRGRKSARSGCTGPRRAALTIDRPDVPGAAASQQEVDIQDTVEGRPILQLLLRREEGQGLAEYALILAMIAMACIAAVTLFGQALLAEFQNIVGQFP